MLHCVCTIRATVKEAIHADPGRQTGEILTHPNVLQLEDRSLGLESGPWKVSVFRRTVIRDDWDHLDLCLVYGSYARAGGLYVKSSLMVQ